MAVNKNFVVKNGLEVNTDLIVADVDSGKVGVGTTISSYLLHVFQGTGIGASSVYVTGISTVAQEFNVGLGGSIFTVLGNAEGTAGIGQSVGVGTGEPGYLLDVRAPVSTGQTALYVQGDVRVTGDLNLDDLRLDQLNVSGISTFVGFSTFAAGITVLGLGATTTTLTVSGVSTFSDDILIGTGATVGFGSTAYFRDNAKVVLGDDEDLIIHHNGSNSIIAHNGTGDLLINTADSEKIYIDSSEIVLRNAGSSETLAKFTQNGSVELYYDDTKRFETTSGGVDVTGTFASTGITTLASGGGITTTGGDLYVGGDLFVTDNITLDTNLNILGIATIGTLDVTSDATFDGTLDGADGHKSLVVGTGLSVHGPSAGVAVTLAGAGGITTTGGDLYVGGDLFISEDIELDTNLNILGIATIGTLAVTGVATAGLIGGYSALSAPASAETKNFAVTVAAKTSNNRYSGGSSNAYYIDGIEAPFLTLTPGRTYRFTLSSSDMSSHPFRFYLEADRSTQYTTDVTSTSTYTEIIVTDTTPTVLHYQCSSHGYMGNSVQTNSNTIVVSAASTFSGVIDSNDTTQSSSTTTGSIIASGGVGIAKQLYVGAGASVGTGLTVGGVLDANGALDVAGSSTFASDITIGTGATVGFGSTAYFRDHAKAIFGDGEDLEVYHDGSDSYISNNTGSLYINDNGNSIYIQPKSGEESGVFNADGSVELYHDNTKRFETTGYGVTVSGGAFVSGISTFVGFVTFSDYVFVQDGLNVAGVITATSFDGLGQIGVGSEGTFIGVGITMVDFKSSNAGNTVDVDGTSGIATVTVQTGVSLGLAIALGG